MFLKNLNTYGFLGGARLFWDVLLTKVFFPHARVIRRPFYIRGKKYIKIGSQFTSGPGLRMDAFSASGAICIEIGDNVQVNDYVHIGSIEHVKIGSNVLIASKVFISDHNHGYYGEHGEQSCPLTRPIERKLSSQPVFIEDNVWIGENACILPGVRIGNGAIVGGQSVVTKNVPPYSIVAGNPAKIIKIYDFEKRKWLKIQESAFEQ
jgi:lipopolysaccharide O-acetyltransferase